MLCNPGDLSSIPGIHAKVEGENWFYELTLWPPYAHCSQHPLPTFLDIQYKKLLFFLPGLFWSRSVVEVWIWALDLKGWLLKNLSHCMLRQKFSRKRSANDALFTGGSWTLWTFSSKKAMKRGGKDSHQSSHRQMRNKITKEINSGNVLLSLLSGFWNLKGIDKTLLSIYKQCNRNGLVYSNSSTSHEYKCYDICL